MGSGGFTSQPQSKTPEPPAGWEVVSRSPRCSLRSDPKAALLTIPLEVRPADGRNLALYTYEDGQWKRLGPATLTNDGSAAQGEVSPVPRNVAVLRRTTLAVQVAGSLPPDTEMDPEAAHTLSVLHTLDFVPAADGILLGTGRPRPQDSSLRVLPTVRALGPPDSEAVDTILASPELIQAHINDIVRVVREGAYDGIHIDYRAVSPARGAEFTQFVVGLADALHSDGRSLSLTLPLPTQQPAGWDTGPYDWQALGQAVDAIELIPEPDQSLYYQRMEDALAVPHPAGR